MTNETIIELQNLVQELQKDIKDLKKQIDKIPNFNYEKRNGTIVLNNVRIE